MTRPFDQGISSILCVASGLESCLIFSTLPTTINKNTSRCSVDDYDVVWYDNGVSYEVESNHDRRNSIHGHRRFINNERIKGILLRQFS